MTAVDLVLLQQELATAGIVVSGLGTLDSTLETVHTYDAVGQIVPLPPSASPVVAAHVAPPLVIDFARVEQLEAVRRTTDGQPAELLRFPLVAMTGYDVEAKVMGVDAGNGAVKKLKVDVTMKRLGSGPLAVGAPSTLLAHQDGAASAWSVAFTFSGNDAVITVTGAVGRAVDWICRASVGRFAPAGL